MAKTAKRSVGDRGEEVAARYLESKGFTVLERNYLRPWGEIDIVAQKGKNLYFVEVKAARVPEGQAGASDRGVSREKYTNVTREPLNGWVRPEENVHPAKLKRLHRAIQTYLLDHKIPDRTAWQVDVACVYLNFATHTARVEMLENVIL